MNIYSHQKHFRIHQSVNINSRQIYKKIMVVLVFVDKDRLSILILHFFKVKVGKTGRRRLAKKNSYFHPTVLCNQVIPGS